MKYFSAFSGIGGFELAAPKDWECVGYSEILPAAIKIYQKHFPKHKNYGDITTIVPPELPDFDVFVGGFPCQDLSIAGSRQGLAGKRSGLFFEIIRILAVKRPTYLLLENVRGMLTHGKGETFKTILRSLDELGYDCEWALFYSADFGKPQSRPRVYLTGTFRGSQRQTDAGERQKQEAPILFFCKTGAGNTNYNWGKIGRMSSRIIRDYAGIPASFFGGSSENDKEVSVGELNNPRYS